MLQYASLVSIEKEAIYEAFLKAFSDYPVHMEMSFAQFEKMLKRKGFDPHVSVGAFNEDCVVGFILNGCRKWNGKATAYDVGTGVIPQFRKQGITKHMLQIAKQQFRDLGAEQYILEVLTSNTSAANIYRKNGFTAQREFLCCQMERGKDKLYSIHQTEHILNPDWELFKSFWDFPPSWQNSIPSIEALSESFIILVVRNNNQITGYGIIDKSTGEIPQIAVDKKWRSKGVGRSILADLIEHTDSGQIKILNIDTRSKAMLYFISAAGFYHTVNQFEMKLDFKQRKCV